MRQKSRKTGTILKKVQASLDATQTVQNLKKVLALNAKINSTLNLDELLGILMNTAAEVMNAHAASLMLMDASGEKLIFKVALGCKANTLKESFTVNVGEGIAGAVAKTGEALIVNDTAKDKRFAKRFDKSTGFQTKAILCVPMRAKEKIIGVLEAINPIRKTGFSENDLSLFQTFADQAAIAVENARMHTELVVQEKTKQELRIAHDIQQNFLPDLAGHPFGIKVAAKNLPARDVGGDFYDVIRTSENKINIVIGDVSGKGVPAALYMVRAISEYRFLASKTASAGEMVTRLNESLAKNSPFGMFVTLLYLVIDTSKKTVSYVSAGHHPILRRRVSGQIESLENAGGLPAGLDAEARYEENTVALDSGDLLFTYTDGLIEGRNRQAEEYGLARLEKDLAEARKGADGSSEDILAALQKFSQGAPAHDDTTVLAVEIP